MIGGPLPPSFALLQGAMAVEIAGLSVDDPPPANADDAPAPPTSSGVLADRPDPAAAPPPTRPSEIPAPSGLSLAGLRAPEAARAPASLPPIDASPRRAAGEGGARASATPSIEPRSTATSRVGGDGADPAASRREATYAPAPSAVARAAPLADDAAAGVGDPGRRTPQPDPASTPPRRPEVWAVHDRQASSVAEAGGMPARDVPGDGGAMPPEAGARPRSAALGTADVAPPPGRRGDEVAVEWDGRVAAPDETVPGFQAPGGRTASDARVGPPRPAGGPPEAPVGGGPTRDAEGPTASPAAVPPPAPGDPDGTGRAPPASTPGHVGSRTADPAPGASPDGGGASPSSPAPATSVDGLDPGGRGAPEAGTAARHDPAADPRPAGADARMRDPAIAGAPVRGFSPGRDGLVSGASTSRQDARPPADATPDDGRAGQGRAEPGRDVAPASDRPAAPARARAPDDRRPETEDHGPGRDREARDPAVADPPGRRPDPVGPAALADGARTALSEALESLAGPMWSGSAEGIIPSLVFNAAMIPGWPPPRPFETPLPDAALARPAPPPPDEAELAHRLAERGGEAFAQVLARMPQKLSRRRRRRLLLAMAAMMDVIDAVLSAVEQELLDVARRASESESEIDEAGLRRLLTA